MSRRIAKKQPAPGIVSVKLPPIGGANMVPFLQGPLTNRLSAISPKTEALVDPVTNEARLENGALSIFLENYDQLARTDGRAGRGGRLAGYRTSTHKLLDLVVTRFTSQVRYGKTGEMNTRVEISLEEWISLLGKTSTPSTVKNVRRTVNEDLNILYATSLEWRENAPGGQGKNFKKTRLVSQIGIENSVIHVTLTNEIAEYLNTSFLMGYNLRLLGCPERNPSTYHCGKKLLLQYNAARRQAGKDPEYALISVKSLLEACPDIPTPEQVDDAHYQRRILQPLEGALDSLDFVEWDYSNPRGRPLSKQQVEKLDFHEVMELFVRFSLRDAP